MPEKSKLEIFGIAIDSLDWLQLTQLLTNSLNSSNQIFIVTINGEILLKAENDSSYKDILQSAELILPDSTNLLFVSKLKGNSIKQTLPGVDLVLLTARICAELDKSIYLLGAKEGIASAAATELVKLHPNLRIAGTSSSNPDDNGMIDQINQANADVILVAFGAPKQEQWIAKHRTELKTKILIGVGGTFDMLSGALPRAPKFLRTLHLEWFWRLLLQPSRIGRIWKALVLFPIKAILS